MEYPKIEETREYLIKEYGEPSVKVIKGMTYKTLNQYLDSFNAFIEPLLKSIELAKLTDVEKQINLICEFAKNATPENMNIITKRLERMVRELSKRVYYSKTKFVKMFNELGLVADKKDFNPCCVINYFVDFLNIKSISYSIKTKHNMINIYDEENIFIN